MTNISTTKPPVLTLPPPPTKKTLLYLNLMIADNIAYLLGLLHTSWESKRMIKKLSHGLKIYQL